MLRRGQGAIEYLLILGAAVIIAIVVIVAMTGILGENEQQTSQVAAKNLVRLKCVEDCSYTITSDECTAMGGTGNPCSPSCSELAPDNCT